MLGTPLSEGQLTIFECALGVADGTTPTYPWKISQLPQKVVNSEGMVPARHRSTGRSVKDPRAVSLFVDPCDIVTFGGFRTQSVCPRFHTLKSDKFELRGSERGFGSKAAQKYFMFDSLVSFSSGDQ